MNSYERYMAVLAQEPVDILPRLPILMQFAAEYIGSNYGAFASDYRVLVEANLLSAENLMAGLRLQKKSGKKLGQILIEQEFIKPSDLVAVRAYFEGDVGPETLLEIHVEQPIMPGYHWIFPMGGDG